MEESELEEWVSLVSIKAVLVLVVALAFILGGGVQILASAKDRLSFETTKIREGINPRGDDTL